MSQVQSLDVIDNAASLTVFMKPFQEYIQMPGATEICVNAPGTVFVEINGRWESFANPKVSYDHLNRLGTAAASFAHNNFTAQQPILSAALPTGERCQFVMPPACSDGTISLTIRRPSMQVRTLDDYIAQGFFNEVRKPGSFKPGDEELLDLKAKWQSSDIHAAAQARSDFLRRAVELGRTVVIAGETGSGKTTLMKALMQSIPTSERIITIEDVPELVYGLPRHKNVVNLFYPSEAGEDGVVTASSLMKSCLRMKPDRILLAELRGGETYDFLNVCLSGHGGSITSCHAGSCKGVFDYLALKVLQSATGNRLSYEIIQRLLRLVIDVVVHVHNVHGKRYISEMWFEPQMRPQSPALEEDS